MEGSIPSESRGQDVMQDGTVKISEPRLYNLIDSEQEGPHEIIIEVKTQVLRYSHLLLDDFINRI